MDLFLTNRPRYFQDTSTIKTGISDFQKLVVIRFFLKAPTNRPPTIDHRPADHRSSAPNTNQLTIA